MSQLQELPIQHQLERPEMRLFIDSLHGVAEPQPHGLGNEPFATPASAVTPALAHIWTEMVPFLLIHGDCEMSNEIGAHLEGIATASYKVQ